MTDGQLIGFHLQPGEIASFTSKIVPTGRTSLVTYICLNLRSRDDPVLDGFITFVYVDEKGNAQPHGLEMELETEEDRKLNEKAKRLR